MRLACGWFCCWFAAAQCVEVRGSRITAHDLAAVVPEYAKLPPESFIAWAPMEGIERVIRGSELERVARRLGVTGVTFPDLCVRLATRRLTREEVESQLRQLFPEAGLELEVVDFSRAPVPLGKVVFTRKGVTSLPRAEETHLALCRGRVEVEEHRSSPIWAKVRLSVFRTRLVAQRELMPGQAFSLDSVHPEAKRQFLLAADDTLAPEELAGFVPVRRIRAGEVIHRRLLRPVSMVSPGETVSVEVVSASGRLRVEARAENSAARGQTVWLKNPFNGRRFTAVVQGPRRAQIELGSNERKE